MREIRLAAAARKIIPIETSEPCQSRRAVQVWDNLNDTRIMNWLGPADRTAALNLYHLDNLRLDVRSMVLMQGDCKIIETANMPADFYNYARIEARQPIPIDPGTDVIIGHNLAAENYFHWMIQILPAIDWAVRVRTDRDVRLALSQLSPWREQSLNLLGLADLPRVNLEIAQQYLLPRAQFSDLVRGSASFQVSRAVASTLHRIRDRVPAAIPGHASVYVARTDSKNRVVENEAALIRLMQQSGVHVVVPGDLSLPEQVALFRAARLVIGAHGAGLANIGFCEPGAMLYELVPRHYPNACFNRLAQAAGLHYWADIFGTKDATSAHGHRWTVDLDTIANRLDAARAWLATGRND